MADLIDRKQVIDTLNDLCKEVIHTDISFSPGCANYLGALHDAKDRINQLLSVKSDIVRCSECKYADWYATIGGEKYCYCMETGASGRTENDFCSYGERDYDGGSD